MTAGPAGLWFGGDYNPEQWDEATWAEDDALMRQARVNAATVGVFSWSLLEPEEGKYDFGWLDDTLDRLHGNGVRVVLATPTASPPPWFTLAHPDAMPVTRDGTRLWHGSRDTYCAAAPAYREAARRIAGELGSRYAGHPALALWHVHNEYGTVCWCDHAARAFRDWLGHRYGPGGDGLAALNDAWGTAFWSQRYADWDQVLPPRATQWLANPSQLLDYRRFWSDELLAAFCEQRDEIRLHTPSVPVTTNFILPDYQVLDAWAWGREVDVVAVDHYLGSPGPDGQADIAFGGDRARSWGGGRPWLLMEQATNLIYAGDRILTKEPGRMLRDSLGYLARGSDSVLFFQWRGSPAGAEMHHAAMVPHAGPDSRVFREVTELGRVVELVGEVAGSTVRAQAAVVWDADSWWALENQRFTSADLSYLDDVRSAHAALWRAGMVSDFVGQAGNLPGYLVVLAPALHLITGDGIDALREYVAGGGHLVMSFFGGVVDSRLHARLGGTPGGLRDVFGITVEEFCPLPSGAAVALSNGDDGAVWSERLRTEGADVLASYADGPLAGLPAITRNSFRDGVAWYVSTRLGQHAQDRLIGRVLAGAGVRPAVPGSPPGLEAVHRHADDGRSWLFVLNHTGSVALVPASGTDLLSGRQITGMLELAPGGVAVVREDRATTRSNRLPGWRGHSGLSG
jgi:beta-galactosidase